MDHYGTRSIIVHLLLKPQDQLNTKRNDPETPQDNGRELVRDFVDAKQFSFQADENFLTKQIVWR